MDPQARPGSSRPCCGTAAGPAPPAQPAAGSTRRLCAWSVAGAAGSAILASACCWLPLLLAALGASAAGAGAFLARLRPYALGASLGLLALGFYLSYARRGACAAEEGCPAPRGSRRRLNRVTLWLAAGLVASLALFPNYVGLLAGGSAPGRRPDPAPAGSGSVEFVFTLEGMRCQGCAAAIRAKLAGLAGVQSVQVDYASRTARVRASDDSVVARVGQAVRRLGYSAALRTD